jgi:hypothetical protein
MELLTLLPIYESTLRTKKATTSTMKEVANYGRDVKRILHENHLSDRLKAAKRLALSTYGPIANVLRTVSEESAIE